MNYETTKTVESEALPGVKFTIKVMGDAARARAELDTADARTRQRELQVDWEMAQEERLSILPADPDNPVPETVDAENLAAAEIEAWKVYNERESARILALQPLERARYRKLVAQQSYINEMFLNVHAAMVVPPWLKAGLISIENLTVAGKPIKTEALTESAPRPLINEIYQAILKEARMTQVDQKNSQSPSSLPAVGDGATNSSTAQPANGKDGTRSESANATSPVTTPA